MKKSESIISDNVIISLLLGIAFSLFFFCVSARMMLNHSSLNYSFNLMYIFFAMVTIVFLLVRENIDIVVTLMSVAFLGVVLITLAIGPNKFIFNTFVVIATIFLPFMMTAIKLPESTFEYFLGKFIKGTNIFCFILVGIGIVDYLSGAAIQIFFARHQIFEADQARLVLLEHAQGIYRYYSFFGGPLANAWYLLAFYALNILYNRYCQVLLNEYLVAGITLVGLILSGSRSALIIGLFMFVFLNNRKHKIVFVFVMSLISFGLAMTPVFQKNLLQRFLIGKTTGNFSEGRNEALIRVLDSFVKPPAFFTGGSLGYSRQITLLMGDFINSFEYPILMYPYDFGILGTILIYMIILVIPTIICLKNKSYFLLVFFLAISLYLNGFNAIANFNDDLGQFCFFIMVTVNMSYLIRRKREEGEET